MTNEIIIDEVELTQFILDESTRQGITLTEEQVLTVLNLEFDFLKLKGVIE